MNWKLSRSLQLWVLGPCIKFSGCVYYENGKKQKARPRGVNLKVRWGAKVGVWVVQGVFFYGAKSLCASRSGRPGQSGTVRAVVEVQARVKIGAAARLN